MSGFAHPVKAPARVDFTSADPLYGVYGWNVAVHRAVREFSSLRGARTRGFNLEGSGTATVITPAVFKRGHPYVVTVRSAAGVKTVTLRANRSRRLTIAVSLGPSNTVQEYPLDGPPVGTKVFTATVEIR